MLAGFALMGTLAAGLAGGAPRAAHADSSINERQPCYICEVFGPSIDLTSTQLNEIAYTKSDDQPGSFYTFTAAVNGSKFPPGDPVHIELVYTLPDGMTTPDGSPLPAGPYTAASADTLASYARTYPLGNGQVVHVAAGHIGATLAAAAVCSNLDTPDFPFQVVATDTATGRTYTTAASAANRLWTNCDFLGTITY